MAPRYTHQSEGWPHYTWDYGAFAVDLSAIHFRRGALMTAMATLGFDVRQNAVLQVLVQDVTKSSEIEGEKLDAEQVRSSIARRLGMKYAGLPAPARDVEGVVEMMLDATQRYAEPLDDERIFGWHAALFPTGRSGMFKIVVGAWRDDRDGPMQVVSGPIGREKVHFEAPAAERVPAEMAEFLRWFETEPLDPVVKAAVAHLWFVTIHPMDDGNGRIGRAIMDMALARADHDSQRFYSMTAQIHRNKDEYYDILERTQKRTLDVTEWIGWFLGCLAAALDSAEGALHIVRRKQAFWDAHRDDGLNERQIKIVNMLFEGFHGKLHTSKYAKIAKCSNSTALRDLNELVVKRVLAVDPSASGRSTSYILVA
jgi:Fic family protein